MKRKILCLFLALALFIVPLWSCDGDGGDDNVDGGGLKDDGSVNWEEVDFKGATVKFGISVDKASGGTFKPAKEYLKGPDASSTDEVLKKVATRNAKVEEDLNMKVQYVELTAMGGYQAVQGDIETKVRGSSSDVPDIYNNDMRAYTYALLKGQLMNVVDPVDKGGNEIASYFDFTSDAWNYDFMKEMTFDSSKVYVLAGDFHIDMVRFAQVIFVNKTMFDQNATALGYANTDTFYRYVKAGDWDYDRLVAMCKAIWQDTGSEDNKTDLGDGRIGFVSNERLYFNFVPSTGITTYYMDDEGKPHFRDDMDEMNRMGNKLQQIWSNKGTGNGIINQSGLDCITTFMEGNVLFAPATLGELESEELREVTFEKGLVPVPKYNKKRQDAYHTMVEMYAELSAVLVNAPSFTKASAYLQYVNDMSADVLSEYYELSLKFKYNSDPSIRMMIDLVYDTIDSPFGIWFESVILDYVTLSGTYSNLHHALFANALSAFYDANAQACKLGLQKALEIFAEVH